MIGPLRFVREYNPDEEDVAEGIGMPLNMRGPKLVFEVLDNRVRKGVIWNANNNSSSTMEVYRTASYYVKTATGGRKKTRKAKRSTRKNTRRRY